MAQLNSRLNCFTKSVKASSKSFPAVYSGGSGKYRNAKASLHLKERVIPDFKAKRSVPYGGVDVIHLELDRLEIVGII